MDEEQKHKRFTDGTSQADRFPEALRKGYIKADEMQFEDLLALGSDYAGILKFVDPSKSDDPNKRHDPSWAQFFASDALVIFAKILATDLKKIKAVFFDIFLKSPDPAKCELDAVPSYQLALDIDYWFQHLRSVESEAGQKLFLIIQGIIEDKLKKQLHSLDDFLDKSHIERDFDPIWHKPQKDEEPSGNNDIPTGKGQSDAEPFLKSNFEAFYNAVLLIQETTRKLLPEALESQVHNPAIGMVVAFLKLYEKVQHKLNQFTGKHLDFYYRKVLKIHPRPIIPDRAFVKFDTDRADREVPIKAGTEFIAGTDENNKAVIYTADNDLLVHSARVERLYTLFLERDPFKSPERFLEYISAAKINELPVVRPSQAEIGKEAPAWPVFGAPRSATEKHVFEDAGIGFAIASPILLLKEGQREIKIRFKIGSVESDRPQSLGGFIDEVIEKLGLDEKPKDTDKQPSGQKPSETGKPGDTSLKADVFYKIFGRMFTIQLTAEDDWYTVEDYLPSSKVVGEKCEDNCLIIQIQLSPKDQAIVPYAAEIHGEGYDTDQPIIRFMMNPMAYLFPYSLLIKYVVRGIKIEVDVKGVKDMVIHNNMGQLDPNSPFNPFGPLPTMGSYFIVGNREAAGKQLTRFDVEVEWAGLPLEKMGFKDYYRAYEMNFDNDVFEAGLTVLNGGKWLPGEDIDQPRIKLFKSDADGLKKSNRLSCRDVVQLFRPQPVGTGPVEFGYDSSKKDGFFKFTLTAPMHAFGHRDYPLKLTSVLTENAKLKKLQLHKPVPNPPYTPQINAISIDYAATASVNLEKIGSSDLARRPGRFYHIHPFGVEQLSPQTHPCITMVPRYESDGTLLVGNLFIGLSPRELSGALTLLFHLRDDSSLKSDTIPPTLKWFYLSANQWERLDKHHVLADTTSGFLSSGIVTLNIPIHQRSPHTTMPGDLFWLRVSVDRHPEMPCSVFSINSQALQVTWQKQDDASVHMESNLPAGTIKESRISIPGIDRIHQIAESFGGRLPEAEDQFKTRVSERLKHKNRATVPWDYERLILDHFPEIYKVKCFSNMVDDLQHWQRPRPGHILIVVIPYLKKTSAANMKPTVDGTLLKEIQDYVAALSSPFATIKVRNPAYEKIQVRCMVQFAHGKAGGYYLQELNQALVDYLSPWNKTGYTDKFGWCVRRYDLKSFILNLDYIDFVTDFSMLRVSEDDKGYYSLFDTVARQVKEINWLFPWSIAIPFKQHYIKVLEKAEVIEPDKTGISELKIGSNFIIPGK